MIYLELFLAFLQVGAFTFGGGYGAVALIRDVVLSRGWLSEEALTDMIAVSESTPGPIMVNMATYVGSIQGGFWGAVTASLAVVLPSFIIILLVMVLLRSILRSSWFQALLGGLKPCVTGIILATGVFMTARCCVTDSGMDLKALILTAILGGMLFGVPKLTKKSMSPILLILTAAVLGMVFYGS